MENKILNYPTRHLELENIIVAERILDKWLFLFLKILASYKIKKGSKLLNKQYNPRVKKVLKSFFLQIVKKNI